jgi:hypothetical protein
VDLVGDFHDRPRDLDIARARLDAVEHGAAAPDAVGVGHDLEPLLVGVVAGIGDEAVGVDDGRGTDVRGIAPEDRAGRGACRAQDAAAGVLVALAIRRGLAPLAPVLHRIVVHQPRHDGLVLVEERLHVDQQVLDQGQPANRLHGDARSGVLDQVLAGEAVAAVDEHRVGAAHPVAAGAAEGQRPVLIPLHLVQEVEHPVGWLGADGVLLPVRLGIGLGVEAPDSQADLGGHRLSTPVPSARTW